MIPGPLTSFARIITDPSGWTIQSSGYGRFIFFFSNSQNNSSPGFINKMDTSADIAFSVARRFVQTATSLTRRTCVMFLLSHCWSLWEIVTDFTAHWEEHFTNLQSNPCFTTGNEFPWHRLCNNMYCVGRFAELINKAIEWQIAIFIAEGAFDYPIQLSKNLMDERGILSRINLSISFIFFCTVLIIAADISAKINRAHIFIMTQTYLKRFQRDPRSIEFLKVMTSNISIKAAGHFSVDFFLLANVKIATTIRFPFPTVGSCF